MRELEGVRDAINKQTAEQSSCVPNSSHGDDYVIWVCLRCLLLSVIELPPVVWYPVSSYGSLIKLPARDRHLDRGRVEELEFY